MIEKLKQNKLVLIVFVIAMIFIVTGVSFALYNILFTGKKEQTIIVGDINFTYNEKTNGLSLDDSSILDNENGMKQTSYFDFDISLTSSGNLSITYQIALEETSTSTLSNDKVKVYLTDQNNNKILDPVSISSLKTDDKGYRKLYVNTISQNETQKYRLRAWIDMDKAYEISNNNGSHSLTMTNATYKFKVNVYDTEVGANTLIKLADNKDSGLYTVTHPADSTLQIGTTENMTEYRYRGASPKNYVTFNNETWRIIGVFPTDDGTGKIESRIKIIRNESIGNKYWNNCTDTNRDYLCDDGNTNYNNWTGATLNTYLNGTYLTGLSSEAQSMIGNTKYYLGGYNTSELQKDVMYKYERKIKNTKDNEFYYGSNPNNFIGKVALMYASDYGYAASDVCTQVLIYYENETCINNNWLFNSDATSNEWTFNQNTENSLRAFIIYRIGRIAIDMNSATFNSQLAVRPVLYLTSNVQITGGTGTSTDPYTLGL